MALLVIGGTGVWAEIVTVQTLAPYDVTSARWQPLYLGYFGFIIIGGNGDASSIFTYSRCGE